MPPNPPAAAEPTPDDTSIVSVRRAIVAPPDAVFRVLTDPVRHVDLGGSGMLRRAVTTRPITGVGSQFVMAMHDDEIGDYEMVNHVVAYERDRHLAWEPEAAACQ